MVQVYVINEGFNKKLPKYVRINPYTYILTRCKNFKSGIFWNLHFHLLSDLAVIFKTSEIFQKLSIYLRCTHEWHYSLVQFTHEQLRSTQHLFM